MSAAVEYVETSRSERHRRFGVISGSEFVGTMVGACNNVQALVVIDARAGTVPTIVVTRQYIGIAPIDREVYVRPKPRNPVHSSPTPD